jgi:mannitol/fructose-specific phosphotransferase system IIA component (Ntr-type)
MDAEFPAPASVGATRRLVDLLPPSHIMLGVSCSDLEDLVSVAVTRLDDDFDPRLVAERVLGRERDQPTLLGGGFAVPHATIERGRDAAIMLTLTEPLALATPDRKPIRVAFLLVGGPDGRSRLEIFARIARLANYDIADELCAAATPAQARAIIERVESLW